MIAPDAETLLHQSDCVTDMGSHDVFLENLQLDARGAELGMYPFNILPTIIRTDQTILLENSLRGWQLSYVDNRIGTVNPRLVRVHDRSC